MPFGADPFKDIAGGGGGGGGGPFLSGIASGTDPFEGITGGGVDCALSLEILAGGGGAIGIPVRPGLSSGVLIEFSSIIEATPFVFLLVGTFLFGFCASILSFFCIKWLYFLIPWSPRDWGRDGGSEIFADSLVFAQTSVAAAGETSLLG
jgi:hypothetical protein